MAALIVASRKDTAAQNIARHILTTKKLQALDSGGALFRDGEVYLKQVETDGIYTDKLDVDFVPDAAIFVSRHRSESNEPALTVHWTGNVTGRADFGGKPKSLSPTDPPRLRSALLALDHAREIRNLNYAVTLEATHHGPTELGVPTLFVELGSTEKEWNDRDAAAAAAEAAWEAATKPVTGKLAVGFGGGHYCNKQGNAIRNGGYAISHIFSKYFFEEYDAEVVRMAYNRTKGTCRTAIIDWKGIRGSERGKLLETLKEMRTEIIRV
ncbi:MAG TPA: D-aminoacyl-tRNA deacylase [Candidatus Acidoferrales bacterium]|nr:D-aminoacyl-tRNA deacylase [Candidatus Acidoferrales bacterium]